MNAHLPFDVVSSTGEVKVGKHADQNLAVPLRSGAGGGENCEFMKLGEMLIGSRPTASTMNSARAASWRTWASRAVTVTASQPSSLQETCEAKKKEEEMRQMFINKVKETEL